MSRTRKSTATCQKMTVPLGTFSNPDKTINAAVTLEIDISKLGPEVVKALDSKAKRRCGWSGAVLLKVEPVPA